MQRGSRRTSVEGDMAVDGGAGERMLTDHSRAPSGYPRRGQFIYRIRQRARTSARQCEGSAHRRAQASDHSEQAVVRMELL